ncbi:MAG: hypothetical protein ACYC8T_31920 [Myxococcaceae bacterium]
MRLRTKLSGLKGWLAVLTLGAAAASFPAKASAPGRAELKSLDGRSLAARAKAASYQAKLSDPVTDPVTGVSLHTVLLGKDGALQLTKFSKAPSKQFAFRVEKTRSIEVLVSDGSVKAPALLDAILSAVPLQKLTRKELTRYLKGKGWEIADSAEDKETGELAEISADHDTGSIEILVHEHRLGASAVVSDDRNILSVDTNAGLAANEKLLETLLAKAK